jgi:hypothetical protein
MTKKKVRDLTLEGRAILTAEALLWRIQLMARDARKAAEDIEEYIAWLKKKHPAAASKLDRERYKR